MRKGIIGAYGLGVLSGLSEGVRIAEEVTRERGVDMEGLFYASAFQAGVDEFLLPELPDHQRPRSAFLTERTTYIPHEQSQTHWRITQDAFSAYLPADWHQKEEYSSVRAVHYFLVDLFDAMSAGTAVLVPRGIPDVSQVEAQLPSELSVPLACLWSHIAAFDIRGPIAQKVLLTGEIQRFNEIITSDVFSRYVSAQSSLDDSSAPLSKVLPTVISAGRDVFSRHRRLLSLATSGLGVLQVTSKLVDAAFGKLPGTLAELTAKLGLNLLESRHRIVIYDFSAAIEQMLISNFARMLKPGAVSRKK